MNLNKISKLAKIGFNRISDEFSLKKDSKTGISRRPPQTVYWIQHTDCNLNCPMCNVPQTPLKEEKQKWISTSRIKTIVNEIADMGVVNFGVSGGEPLMDKNRLFEVLETAAKRSIYTHFGSNGILLNEEIFKRYDDLGVGHISLSADGIGDVHDRIRGRKGVWEKGVLKSLRAFKKVKPENIWLKINSVISNDNIDNLPDLVRFIAKEGHVVFIQPFDPCAYNFLTKNKDARIANERFPQWIPPERFSLLNDTIDELIDIEKENPGTLLNDRDHLEAIRRYFTFDILDKPTPCTIAFKNLWIKSNGNVGYCNYGLVGNLKNESLEELWNCDKMIKIRKRMLHCKFVCLLGCMYTPGFIKFAKKGLRTARRIMKV